MVVIDFEAFDFEARCVVRKIQIFFCRNLVSGIILVSTFRLQYLGLQFSEHYTSFDRVFKR